MSWLIHNKPEEALPWLVRDHHTGALVAACITEAQACRLRSALEAGDVAPTWDESLGINSPASLTEWFLSDARRVDQVRATQRAIRIAKGEERA